MRDFAYDRLRSSPSWFFVQREANNNKTALFTVFRFRAIWTEEWNMTWSIAHEANRCSFWTSSTSVSWKRPFLCIMCNLDHNFHTEMRIYVAQVVHPSLEGTLKMSYLRYFRFSFCHGYMVNKRWHYSAGWTGVHMFHGHQYTKLSCAHSLQVKFLCQENFLPCSWCMKLGTVRS